jgi:DNA-binding MarR family transcriptional regulator
MATKLLSPQELRVWHAFQFMHEDVLARVGRDIAQAANLSGTEYGVLSRLAAIGGVDVRQQDLARVMGWDKSRLSHQLKRMELRSLVKRRGGEGKVVLVSLTKSGREQLDSARPVHALSVRRNLLQRMNAEQTATLVRISNLLGEELEEEESA